MGETVYPANPPKTVIVPADDLIADFMSLTGGVVKRDDMREIVTQVVQALLNEENGDLEVMSSLPDFNRMKDRSLAEDAATAERISLATASFGAALYNRLKSYGAYVDETFSYFFDDFLGWDLVLSNLPH
jgi:hypothetical protein